MAPLANNKDKRKVWIGAFITILCLVIIIGGIITQNYASISQEWNDRLTWIIFFAILLFFGTSMYMVWD